MGKTSTDKRINYLIEHFNVFDIDDEKEVLEGYDNEGFTSIIQIQDPLDNSVIGFYAEKYRTVRSSKVTRKVSVEVTILGRMIAADPTTNKQFVQWMLRVFTKMIKEGDDANAIRFACEDLPIAKEYLEVFEANKRKDNFTKWCNKNFNLKHINDCTDINQYNNLSELFDAVDPYIEKDVSGLRRAMQRFVDMREADIPFKDRDFIVYTPRTKEAATIFHKFTKWCTAVPSQTNFEQYVRDTRPDGKKSKLYVIVPTTLFEGITEELYQIHFESRQFMDKADRSVTSLNIFDASNSLKEYIISELKLLLEMSNSSSVRNKYMSWLYKFNIGYLLFDLIDNNLTNLRVRDSAIGSITKSITKFHRLTSLALTGCGITKVDPSIGELNKLELLSLNRNHITELPNTLGQLKNLRYLTLGNNPLTRLPEEIAELDTANGGSLIWISTENKSILADIKRYLPNTSIIINETYL